VDGAQRSFKRPAVLALGALADGLPHSVGAAGDCDFGDEIRYEEHGPVGYLHFDFYNGALASRQCERLRDAYARARARHTRVIVLMGGADFWCNGMHLHCIEAADSPADASWDNINRIDDLARDILLTDTHLTIAAMQGSAAAGGVFLALAADRVLARTGAVLNPHYRNMGNLFGSEYWTYLLPRRVGAECAQAIMARRLPLGTEEARVHGLIDDHAGPDAAAFRALIDTRARELAGDDRFAQGLADKSRHRALDERARPLADYRTSELERMRMNFYGFDPSYHIARHRFVHRTPHAWTPLHLAQHRLPTAARRREPAGA
jgi:putative two-component system hydrogenase maturation factor HypX/HoxX